MRAVVAFVIACSQAAPVESPPDEGEMRAGIAAKHLVGSPGPALTLTTLDGGTIDLAKLYGEKPVYLKFWATWCTPCREQMPGFEKMYETLGDRIQVIAIDAGLDDDPAAVRAFRDKYGLRMPIVIDDGRLAAALDLQVTPQHVLIGGDARIAYIGHHDGPRLDEAIQKVLAAPSSSGARGQVVAVLPAFRPGDRVRGVSATVIDGPTVEIGTGGRPRALVLFASWCESYLEDTRPETSRACRRTREQVDRLVGEGDVDWLGIASGLWSSVDDVRAYKAETKTRLTLALDADGALFRAFGVHEMPTVVLLDTNGRVVRRVGPGDDLEAAVRALRSGSSL